MNRSLTLGIGALLACGCAAKKPVATSPAEPGRTPPPPGFVRIVPTKVAFGPNHVEWRYEIVGDRCRSGIWATSGGLRLLGSRPCRAGIDQGSVHIYRIVLDAKPNPDGTMDLAIRESARNLYDDSANGVRPGGSVGSTERMQHVKRVPLDTMFSPVATKELVTPLPASVDLASIDLPPTVSPFVVMTKPGSPRVVRWFDPKLPKGTELPPDLQKLQKKGYSLEVEPVVVPPPRKIHLDIGL